MIEKLLEKNNCSVVEAEELAEKLMQIRPELHHILDDWLADRPYKDIQIEGFSIRSLMEDYNLEFTGALLTLDWIYKDFDMAVEALKYGVR